MPMQPSLMFDLGPYMVIPIIDQANFPIVTYRNVGYNPDQLICIESAAYQTTLRYLNPVIKIDRPSVDSAGVWHNITGLLLKDNLGTYTDYNLVWQYHVNISQDDYILLDLRLVKVHNLNPLDVTVYISRSMGFGGAGGIASINLCITAIKTIYNGRTWIGVGFGSDNFNNLHAHTSIHYECISISGEFWTSKGYEPETDIEIDDPNEQDPDGPSAPGGGDGGFDRSSDSNPVPGYPAINGADAGFVRLYYTTSAILNLIASEVYSSNFFDWLAQVFMKPTDVICGIGIVPFIPSLGDRGHHKFGTYTFSTELTSIASPYKTVDCGKLLIEKYYGSAFDYSPYTSIQIFLPFLGMRELDIDEVMGKEIGVVYHCNAYDGSLIAYITTPINGVDSVIAQYTGNCMQQVPFGAGDFSGCVRAALSIATSVVGSIAAAGAAGASLAKAGAEAGKVASGAVKAAGESAPSITDSISNVMGLKPHVEKASVAAGSPGQLACMKPFILRRIPRQSLPSNYMQLNGYPSNIGGKLSDFSGYTEIQQIQLSGVNLTEPEIAEILDTLKGGVII